MRIRLQVNSTNCDVNDQRPEPFPADIGSILALIERCQNTLSEQQRVLLRTPDEAARATAIRGTGLLTRQLDQLREKTRQLEQALQRQETEQGRLRALQ